MPAEPSRGEVWLANLDPVAGTCAGGCAADMIIAVQLTRTARRIPFRVPIDPPEGGVSDRSYVLCDAIRSISKARLDTKRGGWGRVSPAALADRRLFAHLAGDLARRGPSRRRPRRCATGSCRGSRWCRSVCARCSTATSEHRRRVRRRARGAGRCGLRGRAGQAERRPGRAGRRAGAGARGRGCGWRLTIA